MNSNSLKIEARKLLIYTIWISSIWMMLFFTGGVATAAKIDLANDTNIKFIRAYQEFTAKEWKKTDIMVQKREAVIIVPLYPKGFIYSVRGKIGDTGKPFEGLDVDLGDIDTAQANGFLYVGIDQKDNSVSSVTTGIFVFKTNDLDNILSDLNYIQKNNKEVKMINVTLGLLLKKRADRLVAQNKQTEALLVLDQSIGYLEQADEKLYSRTIYQLYREKALIYKNAQDTDNYSDSVNKSYTALIRASEYYRELADRRFDFMKQLTAEEKFILVTRAGFFEDVRKVDWTSKNYETKQYLWGDAPGFDNLAYAYLRIGQYYTQCGNLLLSLKYGEKAIEEAKKTGSKDLLGRTFLQLGQRYLSFGFDQEAEKNFKLALDNFSKPSAMPYLAKMALAGLEARQGKFDAAEERLAIAPVGARNYLPMRDLALASVYSMKQDHDRAIKLGNKNLNYQSWVTGKNTVDAVSGNYLRILDSYAVKGTPEEATKVFNLMNEYLERNGNPPNLKLLYALAISKQNKRFGKDEIAPLQDAIASLETIRPTAVSGKDYEYWENMLKVYDMTIDAMYSKEKYLEALNTVEKARSRRFLDDLGNKRLGAKGALSLMTQRANETLDALALLETDMMEASEKAGIKIRSVYDKDSRLGKKMENYKATLKQVSDADQQFGVVTNIVPVSVENLQKHIPDDTTVLEYYQSADTLYIWVIDKKSITAVRNELSKEKLRNIIEDYYKLLHPYTTKRKVAFVDGQATDFDSLQKEAYKLFITPVEKLIKTKNICIVPYDILNYLPFQSLQDGKQYLIERYAVSYLPSLSVLEYLRKTLKKDKYKILALGNPDLSDVKMDLPAAEKEVEMIREIFPNTEVYKKGKASEKLVKMVAPMYDIIHFAAHGEYDAHDPLSSCIYLSPGAGEDGQLQVREIFDMTINADMVVTSACETALGKIGRGDEVLGLTRAFIYAGANSVLGSLWSISDKATAVFMKEFYTNIKKMGKTEALKQAQIKMIKSKEYSHPFYWAAFNITGAL